MHGWGAHGYTGKQILAALMAIILFIIYIYKYIYIYLYFFLKAGGGAECAKKR